MGRSRNRAVAACLFTLALAMPGTIAGEVLEEVVAKVNDDVITKSDLEDREQQVLAELYRAFTGPELDARVAEAKALVLQRMIDDKVLLHRAQKLFDMTKVGDMYLKMFKEQQNLSDEDLAKALAAEGITADELKKRLVEMSAPSEVIRFEVSDRISIADRDVETYYTAHPEAFSLPAQATVREIVLLAEGDKKEARRAEAEAIRSRVAAPDADFAAIAAEVSDAGTKEKGGLLGTVTKGDLAEALDTASFTLPVGGVSGVMETPYGFHILKVEERTDARLRSLDEVREEVRQKLSNEKFEAGYNAFIVRARSEATIVVMPKYQNRVSQVTR
jgi:peptidyl-prolyl cis-trans isomerase SurA